MLVVTNIRKRETTRYHKTLNREKHHLLGNILAKDILPKSNQTLSFNYKFARNVEVRGTIFKKKKTKPEFHGDAIRKLQTLGKSTEQVPHFVSRWI